MHDITTATDFELAEATCDAWGSGRKDIEGASVERWTKKGDRLYINGVSQLEKHDVYLDLESVEMCGFPSRHYEVDIEVTDGEIVVRIVNDHGPSTDDYELVIEYDAEDEGTDDDSEDDGQEDDEESGDGWSLDDRLDEVTSDDYSIDDEDDEEPEIMTDGGKDVTAWINDETIEAAIAKHDDPSHADALTVDEVRDILAFDQYGVEQSWGTLMDNIEDGHTDVVADTGDLLVLDTGEYTMYGEGLVDYYDGEDPPEAVHSVLSHIHHELAREHTDHNWGSTYPFVVRKPADAEKGQRYVEALVNGLQQKGLTLSQAWGVYGVHAAGYSRNQWAKMRGLNDHSAVSQALRKVNDETAYVPLAD